MSVWLDTLLGRYAGVRAVAHIYVDGMANYVALLAPIALPISLGTGWILEVCTAPPSSGGPKIPNFPLKSGF